MPRSHSSRSSKPSNSVTISRPPIPSTHATPAFQSQAPSFGQVVKEGFALGTGQAIAHRMIGSIFGHPTVQTTVAPSQQKIESPCEKERTAFEVCMKTKSSDDYCGNEQASYAQCVRLSQHQ